MDCFFCRCFEMNPLKNRIHLLPVQIMKFINSSVEQNIKKIDDHLRLLLDDNIFFLVRFLVIIELELVVEKRTCHITNVYVIS